MDIWEAWAHACIHFCGAGDHGATLGLSIRTESIGREQRNLKISFHR